MTSDLTAIEYIARLVFEQSGITLYEGRNPLIETKLMPRIRKLRMKNLDEYIAYLRSAQGEGEVKRAVDLLTSNLTFFFRDVAQLEFLITNCLPQLNHESPKLRLWSVPCSSGEEPYSLAILLSELLSEQKKSTDYDWTIHASDLSATVIKQAQDGVYPIQSLVHVPEHLHAKYFDQNVSSGTCRVRPAISAKVRFDQRDLLDDHAFACPFDVILCRNLFIYFDWHQQQVAATHLARYLVPGGYLLIGDLEDLEGLTVPLERVTSNVYRKPQV